MMRSLLAKIKKHKNVLAILLLITVVGGIMRFYNLNWDSSSLQHPDELNIVLSVTKISIPDRLDPQFYSYNGFSIYLYRLVAQVLSFLTRDTSWQENWGNINL